MRGWRTCSALSLLLGVCVCACDSGDGLGDGGFDYDPRPDRRRPRDDVGVERDHGTDADVGGGCPGGRYLLGAACLDRCTYIEAAGCTDRDGDCYPKDCPDLPFDCDDTRPGSRPGGVEVCDGSDNDCDDQIDEGFGVGANCAGCGGDGKMECHVDDQAAVACSTNLGQSDSPDPATLEELCNEADDDCDGATDESCRYDLPEAARTQPLVCGERVLWVEEGALVEVTEAGVSTVRPAPVAHPACDGDELAWLDPGDGCAEQSGVTVCTRGHLWVLAGEEPRDVTGLAVVGPPMLSGGHVYWHALVGDAPVLSRQLAAGGGVETLFEAVSASDPTAPVEGRMVARFWTGGEAEVAARDIETGQGNPLLAPEGAPGAPVANDAWVVWPAGEASSLWVVDRTAPRNGFQLTMRDGPQRAPRLDGDRLVWLDESTSPSTLRSFDLRTGVVDAVAQGEIATDGYALGAGVVVWIDGTSVRRHRWAP